MTTNPPDFFENFVFVSVKTIQSVLGAEPDESQMILNDGVYRVFGQSIINLIFFERISLNIQAQKR